MKSNAGADWLKPISVVFCLARDIGDEPELLSAQTLAELEGEGAILGKRSASLITKRLNDWNNLAVSLNSA